MEWLLELCSAIVLVILGSIVTWIFNTDLSWEPSQSLIFIARWALGLAFYGAIGAFIVFGLASGFKQAWADLKKRPESAWKEIGRGTLICLACVMAAVVIVLIGVW